jgi:RNA polymerase sigma factor (sigma-70 family)
MGSFRALPPPDDQGFGTRPGTLRGDACVLGSVPRMRGKEAAVGEQSASDLVLAAVSGDEDAWNRLVDRYAALVWSVARAHRLSAADAADVSQTTWLRLVEHLGRLRDPEHVGGWLATTARHESLRVLRRGTRELARDAVDLDREDDHAVSPEDATLLRERDALLWQAVDALAERCRVLLRALAASPPRSYMEISDALAMPVGSIGPTRARCLDHLRREMARLESTSDSARD